MTAYTFTLRTRERGQLVGQAVLCLEARYVSVTWTTSPYPDRRFATPAQWKAIQSDLDMKLPAAPLEDQSAIVQVMVGDRASGVLVQYLTQEPVPEGRGRTKSSCSSISGYARYRKSSELEDGVHMPARRQCPSPPSRRPAPITAMEETAPSMTRRRRPWLTTARAELRAFCSPPAEGRR